MVIPYLRADSHALRTRAPLRPKPSFDLHVLGMPPAFILSHDQTLKFMSDIIAVEFHDHTAHLKEPLCTISFRQPVQPKPDKPSITYGYVKDI